MASRDLAHRITSKQTIANSAHTAAVAAGTTVDTQFYESVTFEWVVGAWTDGTHTLVVQESVDNSVWTAVDTGNFLTVNDLTPETIGTYPAALTASGGANQNYIFGYIGGARYVRCNTTVSGATTGAVYGVNVILGHGHRLGGAQ